MGMVPQNSDTPDKDHSSQITITNIATKKKCEMMWESPKSYTDTQSEQMLLEKNGGNGVKNGVKYGARPSWRSKWRTAGWIQKEESHLLGHTDVSVHSPKGDVDILKCLKQWIWVWTNSGRQWRTGKPGVLQFMGSQSIKHELVTEQQQWSKIIK